MFAAGDATSFPVKQGGLAAQQADAVAETIAASVGVDIDPQPFRPILRGLLLTGGPPRYLQADISGRAGDDSTISGEALWWPPDKLAGRYLAPYLSRQVGERPRRHAPGRARDPDRGRDRPRLGGHQARLRRAVRSTVPLTVAPPAHAAYLDGEDGDGRLTSRKTPACGRR